MPKKKRYRHSLKIGLGDLEVALLDFLRESSGEPAAEQIRQCIQSYACQRLTRPREFSRWAAKHYEPKLKDLDLREAFMAQVRDFEAQAFRVAPELEQSSPTVVPAVTGFSSDKTLFEDL